MTLAARVCATLALALVSSHSSRVEAKKVHALGPPQLVARANDTASPGERRRGCVFELFRRYVRPDLPVEELHSWGPVSTWFDERSLFDADKYSAVPVARVPGQPVFMFKPNLPGHSDAAIYLRLSRLIGLDELLAVLSCKTRAPDLKIVEIGFSEPA